MHAVQKFVKYSWVNNIFRAQVHSFIHSVVRILRFFFFLMGRWAINSHFFYGWTVLKVLVLSQLWRCKGFVAVWLFTFFLINCLLFYCHSIVSCFSVTFHFVSFFSFLTSSFRSHCHVVVPWVVLFCTCGVFLTMPFLRKHASRKLHPPYQVSVPAPQHVGGFVWDFLGKWVLCKATVCTGWNVTAGCCCCCCLGLLQLCFFS